MNKSVKTVIFIACFVFVVIFPLIVEAAGLVPCGQVDTPKCRICHFLLLIRNIITFASAVIVPLTLLGLVVGGVLIIISRGSVNLATKGRELISMAIKGFVIVLISWVLINSIIVALVNPGVFPLPWNAWNLNCPTVRLDLASGTTRISNYTVLNDIYPSGASPGDTVRYTLTIINSSSQNLSNFIITSDYNENEVTSITNILNNGSNDGQRIIWNIGNLNAGQSITVSYDFVLTTNFSGFTTQSQESKQFFTKIIEKIFKFTVKDAFSQTAPTFGTAYFENLISVDSNEAEFDPKPLADNLKLTVATIIVSERTYYLTKDLNDNKHPSVGDAVRYNIKYFNPSSFNFENARIIINYEQAFIQITSVDSGGVDNGDSIVWDLGTVTIGQPSYENPACLGFNFVISSLPGTPIFNTFTAMAGTKILETNNDSLDVE